MIGIKLADGAFYPILAENTNSRKRLTLTTAHDNQESVQIDLFREKSTVTGTMLYIGSIVVDNIVAAAAKEPSIALDILSNTDGIISATAVYTDEKNITQSQSLQISLTTTESESVDMDVDGVANFELEFSDDIADNEEQDIPGGKTKTKSKLLIIIIILLLLLLGGGTIILLSHFSTNKAALERSLGDDAVPVFENEIPPPEPVTAAEPALPEPVPEIAPPPEPVVPPPPKPVVAASKPAAPKAPVEYKIKYGDTLWDISRRFYNNPWDYRRIARYNNIWNPAHIVSGTTIRIPPK